MSKTKLTFWNFSNSNTRTNIKNLPTHFLLKVYHTGQRYVHNGKGSADLKSISKVQKSAIHDLLRLRAVKRGVLKND